MDLGTVLARKDNVPVSTLLEALQATLEFEAAISARFHASFEDIVRVAPPSTSFQRPLERISKVFEGYLGVYVDAQDKCVFSYVLTETPRADASAPMALQSHLRYPRTLAWPDTTVARGDAQIWRA